MRVFSWTLLDDGRLVKELDYSAFKYRGTAIPKQFHSFFGIKDKKNKRIRFIGESGAADLKWVKWDYKKVRMIWSSGHVSLALRHKFYPDYLNIKPHSRSRTMKMVFKKTSKPDEFHLELIGKNDIANEKINFDTTVTSRLKASSKKALKKKPKGSKKPTRKTQSSEQVVRDPKVHAWILNNSKWVCECCNNKAPFSKTDGHKYLEVHHVKRLADGGSDTITNAIAVCPNCHRELHYGENKDNLVNSIYKTKKRLIKEN